ncbi:MAG: hypothetical protein U5K30_00335 [Acidimicrobiales bacterium]|nr:hypothetical protein [Acidimicrobiales bacterium]
MIDRISRPGAALAVALLAVAACSGSDGGQTATADTSTTTTSPTTTTADDQSADIDETLALDRGTGAPDVASHIPADGPDEAIGRPGFTRYVYVDSAGTVIPSLVEGPVAEQQRCQDPALPCSAEDLRSLHASGGPIPPELDLTADELTDLVGELDAVNEAIEAYATPEAACAAGFRPDRTQTPNMGSHFVSMDRIANGRFEPGNPEIIMFARSDGEPPDGPLGDCTADGGWDGVPAEAVGVAYFQPFAVVGDEHLDGFTGDFDNWHVHYNLCRLAGRDLTVPPAVCAAQDGTVGEFEPGQAPVGDASEGWMIHAWADPDHDSQIGVFSMWNPSIWPVSDPTEVASDAAADARRGAGTEVIDDFTLPDITLGDPGPVNFFNADGVPHNVTAGTPAQPGSLFDSGILNTREVATVEIGDTGEIPYFCSLHPDMRGTITVE